MSVTKGAIEDDPYKVIVSGYESILESGDYANNDIAFRKVAIVIDEIEKDKELLKVNSSQATPNTWLKLDYFYTPL